MVFKNKVHLITTKTHSSGNIEVVESLPGPAPYTLELQAVSFGGLLSSELSHYTIQGSLSWERKLHNPPTTLK